MAHKKAGGSTALGRDSEGKRLGVKLASGSLTTAGNIIVRQRGSKFRAGRNVKRCKDDTLLATAAGVVKFSRRKLPRFNGRLIWASIVHVLPVKK